MFRAAVDATLVVDEEGRILLANPAAGSLLGRSPAELAGQSVESLVPERFRAHAAQRAAYAAAPSARPMGRGMLLYARHAEGIDIPVDISLTPLANGGRRLVV